MNEIFDYDFWPIETKKRDGFLRDFSIDAWLFFFLLRGGVYSVENFVRQFICPLSLLDREVGLIAEWNMEVQRRRFVPANIFSIKEECSPISRYRCVPLIALASVFNIFSMESRLLFPPSRTLVCPPLTPILADILYLIR